LSAQGGYEGFRPFYLKIGRAIVLSVANNTDVNSPSFAGSGD
jgi:hypothetical protein